MSGTPATRALLAFDKFKGSLTASEACAIAARVLLEEQPTWGLDLCPLTDGGEGFAEIMTNAVGGEFRSVRVTAPDGALVQARFGFVALDHLRAGARKMLDEALGKRLARGRVAVVEMAAASGLTLVSPDRRSPWGASTQGTGELLRAAADAGADIILLGVGGSATHDLGFGALAALGVQFLDEQGQALGHPCPANWDRLHKIKNRPSLELPPLVIASDVTNPLLGPQGAARVYARQKGFPADQVDRLESATARVAELLRPAVAGSRAVLAESGAGAGGGIVAGLRAVTPSRVVSGFTLVEAWLDLDSRIANADLILTGEGCYDESSLSGKGPGALARRAREKGRPTHLFAGSARIPPEPGVGLHVITPSDTSLETAFRWASRFLAEAVRESARALRCGIAPAGC